MDPDKDAGQLGNSEKHQVTCRFAVRSCIQVCLFISLAFISLYGLSTNSI